jgi:hypothetical protein
VHCYVDYDVEMFGYHNDSINLCKHCQANANGRMLMDCHVYNCGYLSSVFPELLDEVMIDLCRSVRNNLLNESPSALVSSNVMKDNAFLSPLHGEGDTVEQEYNKCLVEEDIPIHYLHLMFQTASRVAESGNFGIPLQPPLALPSMLQSSNNGYINMPILNTCTGSITVIWTL